MDQDSWWTKVVTFVRGGPSETASRGTEHDNTEPLLRLVIDTNIFIAAVRAPQSHSRQLLDAVGKGEAILLVSPPVFREYHRILSKAVGSGDREQLIREWIRQAHPVSASRGPRVILEDADDDKFVELARVGGADAIVSNDAHLLDAAGELGVAVLRPGRALGRVRGV